ncbi:MAG: hypothetical protein ABJA34_01195 [Pseudonocardiales bacterium]
MAAGLTFFTEPARRAAVLALAGLLFAGGAALARSGAGRVLLSALGMLQVAPAAVGVALPQLGDAGAPAGRGWSSPWRRLPLSTDWRRGAAGAARVLLGATTLAVLRLLTLALAGPLLWVLRRWGGAAPVPAAVSPYWPGNYSPSVLVTAILVATADALLGWLAAGRRVVLVTEAGGLLVGGRPGAAEPRHHSGRGCLVPQTLDLP